MPVNYGAGVTLTELDRTYGALPDVFEWVVPPPTFHVRVELMERVEHADAVSE